ncbi:MAG: DUF1924 domain-containing protein [Burkholderiales bacterium]|nr:DUF1924 domain-containing protein [Burkholderiales bacterium]
MTRATLLAVGMLGVLTVSLARAQTPADMLARYDREARQANAAFQGFSAARGEQFFRARHGGEWSCSSCHTESPVQTGRHARTGKSIAPLAPAAEGRRFSDGAKVEKWFKRNCNDVLSRACTAAEKGDVLTWLTSLRK